ncbi:MAG: ATP-binding protein [Candidatus Ornithomonoglobus sp.]
MPEITIEAKKENLKDVLSFLEAQTDKYDCPPKVIMQLNLVIEELFVNIASYAYNSGPGTVRVRVDIKENPLSVVIEFADNGVQYDPLANDDPDITLSAEERQIGGLGIYMVKSCVDNISYKYENGQNILTIEKNIS